MVYDFEIYTVHASKEEDFNNKVKFLTEALKENYSLSTQINRHRISDKNTLVCYTIIIEKNKREDDKKCKN